MATNYSIPKFAFYHLFRRSTYWTSDFSDVDQFPIVVTIGTGDFVAGNAVSWTNYDAGGSVDSTGSGVVLDWLATDGDILTPAALLKVRDVTGTRPNKTGSHRSLFVSTGTSGRKYYDIIENEITRADNGTWQESANLTVDDYNAGAYSFGAVTSNGQSTSPTDSTNPTWSINWVVQSVPDPSGGSVEFRPAFIPKSLIFAPGHGGLDDMVVYMGFSKLTGSVVSDTTYSSTETVGTVNSEDAVVIDFNWMADSNYEDKNYFSVFFVRSGDPWNDDPPFLTEIVGTRIITPTRGPVANWQHTEDANAVVLKSKTGTATMWVQGKSLRRWSLVYDKLANDTGSDNPTTNEPAGWNLEPTNGTSGNGSDPYKDEWIIHDLMDGTGAGIHPFWFYPPNGGGWVFVRVDNVVDVRNDFPAPGVKTTDQVRLDLVEVIG